MGRGQFSQCMRLKTWILKSIFSKTLESSELKILDEKDLYNDEDLRNFSYENKLGLKNLRLK